MNNMIRKLNRTLMCIAFFAFFLGAMSLLFCFHIYQEWQDPVEGMKVTFEMWQTRSLLLKILLFQYIPLLAGSQILSGIVILYCVRKRSLLEQAESQNKENEAGQTESK
jgi:hypothetical protein